MIFIAVLRNEELYRRKKYEQKREKYVLRVMHFFNNFFIIKEKRNSGTDNQ